MKSKTWRRRLRPAFLLVTALALTFALASPARAVEVVASCYGWVTVGSQSYLGAVYTVQARSCVEKASNSGAVRAHTGVRFLKSGSGTSEFQMGKFDYVYLMRTPSAPAVAETMDTGIGDPGGLDPGPSISGYSHWRCGAPHEFWVAAQFDYIYPSGHFINNKQHASYSVNLNPDC